MLVRRIKTDDLEQVAQLHSLLHGRPVDRQEVSNRVEAVKQAGGAYFVAAEAGKILGYASYALVPAIPGWYNLNLFIHPQRRKQALGSALVNTIVKAARELPQSRALLAIFDMDDMGLAYFFGKAGFQLEKYDWCYELPSLDKLPPPSFPPGITLSNHRANQVERFVKLHYRSFADTAYFQPFQPEEVKQEQDATPQFELIFACDQQGRDVGVVWLRLEAEENSKTVIIEPIGIVPEWRRKGLGRALMLEALHRAKRRGATRSELWFGSWNDAARQLYEQLGYRRAGGKVSYVMHFS